MATLVEFLDPLSGASQQDKALAVLYYLKHEEGEAHASASGVREGLGRARVPGARRMNVSRALGNCGPRVDRDGPSWSITPTGEDYIRDKLVLPSMRPQAQHDVQYLEGLAARVEDETVRGYIQEAIKCLQVEAFRAAIVFLWTGAVARLRDELWKQKSTKEIRETLQAHRQNAKFRKKEDFAYVQDSELLQIAFDLALIDKTQKGMLGQNLELRNGCGHPTKFNPGEKKTSSFIDDVVGIVFS